VADAPLQTGTPPFDSTPPRVARRHLAQGRLPTTVSDERRDGRKMIGPGEDVEQACRQSCE
jgi:hypothetical protein